MAPRMEIARGSVGRSHSTEGGYAANAAKKPTDSLEIYLIIGPDITCRPGPYLQAESILLRAAVEPLSE